MDSSHGMSPVVSNLWHLVPGPLRKSNDQVLHQDASHQSWKRPSSIWTCVQFQAFVCHCKSAELSQQLHEKWILWIHNPLEGLLVCCVLFWQIVPMLPRNTGQVLVQWVQCSTVKRKLYNTKSQTMLTFNWNQYDASDVQMKLQLSMVKENMYYQLSAKIKQWGNPITDQTCNFWMGAASTQTAVKEYSITQLTKNGVLTIQEKKTQIFYCSATMSYKNSQYHPTNAA